jgi:predicted ATPase
MMKNNTDRLRITVSNFRAIENADIVLNGITVLSGTNGTGKSTISRLLYEIIDSANNFDDLVLKRLNRRLDKYYVVLESIAFFGLIDI